MITVENNELKDLRVIQPAAFEDHRGNYVETYNEQEFSDAGVNIKFVQDDYSVSTRHVLRGLHGDANTWKLVYCPYGKFYLVALDLRDGSPTYGQWESFTLSDRNHKMVLIPPGVANGHLIMSELAVFSYKQSEYYEPESQFTIKYNDERFNIWWPIKQPIVSQRDDAG